MLKTVIKNFKRLLVQQLLWLEECETARIRGHANSTPGISFDVAIRLRDDREEGKGE